MALLRTVLVGLTLLLSDGVTWAYNYQEHKDIGNAAFTAALRRMVASGLVTDSLTLTTWLSQYGQMAYDGQSGRWFFPDLSHMPNMITYGELNALSGDHSENPLQLQDGLRFKYSDLNRVIQVQNEYGSRFYSNAPNKELFDLDHTYGFFAIIHFLHFTDGKVDLLDSLPADLGSFQGRTSSEARKIETFYVNRFGTLSLVPVPFGSDLSRYNLPDSLKQLNQLPYFRQHIIRRVANSAKLYVGALKPARQADANTYLIVGGRYLFSPFTYTYRDYYRKAGNVDRWFGMTTSVARGYQYTETPELRVTNRLTQWQAGVYHKADIWVSNDRYMGLNMYLEGGGIWYDGKLQAVFSPTARVELFPLLISARKNVSPWLRIPYMLLRPLSFTYSRQFTANRDNSSMATVEIDLTF